MGYFVCNCLPSSILIIITSEHQIICYFWVLKGSVRQLHRSRLLNGLGGQVLVPEGGYVMTVFIVNHDIPYRIIKLSWVDRGFLPLNGVFQ